MAMSLGPFQVRRMIVVLLVVALPCSARAYTPDSPAVRDLVARAVTYLRTSPTNEKHSGKLGGRALVGLAIYKYELRYQRGGRTLAPYTNMVLGQIKETARDSDKLGRLDNYSLGISLIFLTEIRPNDNMGEITILFDELESRQLANGAWTYNYTQKGDTSQTQYAVLGAWSAKSAGIDVPQELMDRVAGWLIRTQTPNGAWAYQAIDPGSYQRINQEPIRPATVAAGLGSLYVFADFVGMAKKSRIPSGLQGELPAALIPVADYREPEKRRLSDTAVDVGRLKQAMEGGNEWLQRNFTIRPQEWQFYYLYALERYYSFRESAEGKSKKQPQWYNEGIRVLMELQEPSGAIYSPVAGGSRSCDRPVGTAFGVLFAVRSTKVTIEQKVERDGVLRGGYGMPSDLSEARLKGNRIVTPAITGEVNDLVAMLEDEDAEKIEKLLENSDALSLSGLDGDDRTVTTRLWRILRTGSYQARIIAARTLGRQGDLDNVPILIYALTDQDPRVVRQARDGLRLTGRKFNGLGLSDHPDEGEVKAAVKRWQAWYKSIRPDAVFVQ